MADLVHRAVESVEGFVHSMVHEKAVVLTPGTVVGSAPPPLDDAWPEDPEKVPLAGWDSGVYITELMNLNMIPGKLQLTDAEKKKAAADPEALMKKAAQTAPEPIREGTWRGTQLALTKHYELIEVNYKSYMDAANFEPTIPPPMSLEKKRQFFQFTYPDPSVDYFPPHLNLQQNAGAAATAAPLQSSALGQGELFNKMRLAQLTYLIPAVIPQKFLPRVVAGLSQKFASIFLGPMGTPDQGKTIADVEMYNHAMRSRTGIFARNDIFNLPNIGDLADWFSDDRFAQQQFTGTNPTSIELASDTWIERFINAAGPDDKAMKEKIEKLAKESRDSLYMQDYSYFRAAAGMTDESADISAEFSETVVEQTDQQSVRTQTSRRYGVASVCLFHLKDDGKLSPLSIVIDWKGTVEKSVFIYNKELDFSKQKTDWPWRYAKTAVQSSDWMRHEVTVHLTNCHLVEEATIVAAQRSFENDHIVFQLLYPHWQKTLALNAAARTTLIPHVIIPLAPFEQVQCNKFIISEFNKFDFQGRYVPKDLKNRGFDPDKIFEPKYRNYAYARCILRMWYKIRSWVSTMLAMKYKTDEAVANDQSIQTWCKVMQAAPAPSDGGAGLKTFPTITTFEGLVDAVTMCIHIASPQHSSVNYLQNYYQSFVINKPPSFYTPPPTTRAKLLQYTERDLVAALPMNRPREWLLASHIPYLLSFKPGDKESLIIFAASKYHLYKKKKNTPEDPNAEQVKEAAYQFYLALARSEKEFKEIADKVWDADIVRYEVLSPSWNAVSILI